MSVSSTFAVPPSARSSSSRGADAPELLDLDCPCEVRSRVGHEWPVRVEGYGRHCRGEGGEGLIEHSRWQQSALLVSCSALRQLRVGMVVLLVGMGVGVGTLVMLLRGMIQRGSGGTVGRKVAHDGSTTAEGLEGLSEGGMVNRLRRRAVPCRRAVSRLSWCRGSSEDFGSLVHREGGELASQLASKICL